MKNKRLEFEEKQPFLEKLAQLVREGIPKEDITVLTPFHVHEVEETLDRGESYLNFFTFTGAVLGLLAGFALTIYTVLRWPIMTSAKANISTPAFIIIAFELTILFGAIASLIGFLIFAGLPSGQKIIHPDEHDNMFVILLPEQEKNEE